MKKTYFLSHVMFTVPLLITFLVSGSGLVLLYNLPYVKDHSRVIQTLTFYLLGVTIFSFLVGLALAYALLVPLRTLDKLSKDLIKGEEPSAKKAGRQAIHFEKEIEDVFASFEQTRSSLADEKKKELFQHLSSMGLLASGVAHEIRNPLGSIKGLADLIDEDFSEGDPKKRYIQVILSEIKRLEEVVTTFLSLTSGKTQDLKRELVDLRVLLDEIMSLAAFEPSSKKIKIVRNVDGLAVNISGYKERLKQAFLNIILNAHQAMPEGGALNIATRRLNNNFFQVEFSDTGSGIEEEDMAKLFTPFFTTKEKNIGLGLTITQQIILAHQGNIEIKSKKNKGTIVTITLPRG